MAARPDPDPLNLESDDFDAARALARPEDVALQFPDVQPLSSLSHCLPLLPPELRKEIEEGGWLQGGGKKTDEEVARRQAKKEFLRQRAAQYALETHREATHDLIRAIADRVKAGPLVLLRRLYFKTARVDIVLRHGGGVRGVMRATLHGFDKFFNMLLADIHEVFVTRERVVRVKPKHGAPEGGAASGRGLDGDADDAEDATNEGWQRTQTRVGWKQELRQRRIPRTILKGDHVVMVSRAQGVIRLPGALGQRFNSQIEEVVGA